MTRPTFQLVAICITIFSGFLWFSSTQLHSSRNFEQNLPSTFLKGSRAPPTPLCNVRPNLVVDEPSDDPIWDIQNRTLGFQKIYAISMPHRIDKRDYQALMALVSGLDIEFVDGVNGSEIHPKALPNFWKGEEGAGTIGCWRAHLNIYQSMIQEKIQTALILEDDADWDVLIRAQMTEAARGARYLQNAALPLHSPYGDDWDIFTIGHYGVDNKPYKNQQYWVTKDDPTVIAPSRRPWPRKPDLSAPALGGDHTRIIHEVYRFTATQAYAISLRGAARVLYDQTLQPHATAIDLAMAAMCKSERWGPTSCLGAYPMIFGRFRPAGPKDADSDRRASTNEADPGSIKEHTGERAEAESEFTVFPVSLNVEKLLANEWVISAQLPQQDMQKNINLREFVFPRGGPVVVKPDEYINDEHP
ncbi:hypothetical protein CC78DRAFT_464096 [Lojkania enalia]|uniref:Glycosyl transferase family 25 domain-containing protein n=1 Tax=Lojkania enalia TaxID=147567 RepID=A0A9P4N8B4_9PLEO|nr:hypothetical protein CC78DRAFT_464096 [Didymosphaeria enalia]